MSLFPISSEVDALREYFSRMDIEMLDLILNEKNTYSNLKKEVFLEKLDDIFEKFKASGDTCLKIYRGECSNCYKRCRGYTLLGNNSQNYLDLLVKEENDRVKDIFYCSELVNYKDFEKEKAYILNFELDETADFEPDEDYLILVQKCEISMDYWNRFRNRTIDMETIQIWLDLNRDLYEQSIEYFLFSKHDNFFSFYHRLNVISGIIPNRSKIIKELNALQNILSINLDPENDLVMWLVKNENLGRSDAGEISLFFDADEFRNGKILLNKSLNIYMKEEYLKDFFLFENYFNRYYDEKLEKYNVFTEAEMNAMEVGSELYQNASSLSYHILQRNFRSGKSGLTSR